MKYTKLLKRVILSAILLAASATATLAGQYVQDFSAAAIGTTSLGDGSTLTSTSLGTVAGVFGTSKELQLTARTSPDTRSAFLLPDLDPGQPVYAFSARWDSRVQGYFLAGFGGEGFSFNLGSLAALDLISTNVAQEDGFGAGLSVGVRTDNTNAPGFYLRVNGAVLTNVANVPLTQWGDNDSVSRHAFQVDWHAVLGLSLKLDGVVIFTNVPTPGFVPQAGDRFAWGARNSAQTEYFNLDTVVVTNVNAVQLGLPLPVLTNATAAAANVLSQVAFTANLNSRGLDTMVVMELGTNTSYGTSVTNYIAAGNTNGLTAFSGFVPVDFERATALHGRIRVSNAAGAVSSADLTFASEGFALRLSGRLNNMTALGPMGDNVAWMDADNDGHLDLWVMGATVFGSPVATAALFYNPNTSGITNWAVQPVTPGAGYLGCILLGDVNNDNRPDALLAGSTGNGVVNSAYSGGNGTATVYLGADRRGQIGLGWFGSVGYVLADATLDSSNPAARFGETRGAIRDFDHDGKQDLLLTGWKESTDASFSRMFHNVFAGTTATSNLVGGVTSIPAMGASAMNDPVFEFGSFFISAGHLTGDGFPDVYAYCDRLNYSFANQNTTGGWGIYRNNGELDFNVVQSGPSVDTVNLVYGGASSVWADFNGDGFEDLLVCEGTPFNSRTQILLNDGAGHLTNSSIVLPQLNAGSVAAGDLFNHGRNDIVISGWQVLGYNIGQSQIFVLRNDGNGVFTPVDFGLYATASRSGTGFALADYDDDGRLDLAVIGGGMLSLTIDSTSLYRNKMNIPTNHPPTAPGGLSTTVGAGTVTFHWNTATDDLTPTNLLTYNLRVGTNTLGTQTVSPIANVTNGWRKIAAPGNVGHCFNTLYRFPPGTYYWSVQAIDGIFAGGAWATEGTFTITQTEIPILDIARVTTNQHAVKWPARFPDYSAQRKTTLQDANWTAVTNTPLVTNGKLTVNVSNAPATGFFRLSKP